MNHNLYVFSHKLRRVLRKALLLSEENFKMKKGADLVKTVSNQVAEVLGPTYPEIGTNLKQVISYMNNKLIDNIYILFQFEVEKLLEQSSNKFCTVLKFVLIRKVHFMIDHENELLKVLKGGSAKQWQELTKQDPRLAALTGFEAPGLPAGYNELMTCLDKGNEILSGDLAFHLYDTHGLDPDTIQDLAEVLGNLIILYVARAY